MVLMQEKFMKLRTESKKNFKKLRFCIHIPIRTFFKLDIAVIEHTTFLSLHYYCYYSYYFYYYYHYKYYYYYKYCYSVIIITITINIIITIFVIIVIITISVILLLLLLLFFFFFGIRGPIRPEGSPFGRFLTLGCCELKE